MSATQDLGASDHAQGQPPAQEPPEPSQLSQGPVKQLQVPYLAATSDIMEFLVLSSVPEFWTDQPRLWFIRTEAVLAPLRMGDDVKFDIIVTKLPNDVILQLTDFLSKPPTSGKYGALKNQLFSLLEDSKDRQIEKLMEMDLGDEKPSQLLRRMQNLAKDVFSDDTLM